MRSSAWSSDVCSSDLLGGQRARGRGAKARGAPGDDGGYGGVEFHLVLPNSSPPRRRGPLAILLKADSGPRLRGGDAEFSKPLDDGDVGLAAAFAHRLEAILAAGGIEHAEQGRHQLGAARAERVAERDRAAVNVYPRGVGAQKFEPRDRHRGERIVDFKI